MTFSRPFKNFLFNSNLFKNKKKTSISMKFPENMLVWDDKALEKNPKRKFMAITKEITPKLLNGP